MQIQNPTAKVLYQEPGLIGIYKQIERAGRTCYKSEDKITETSAEQFVERMIASKHHAMLAHGTVYLQYVIDWNLDHDLLTKQFHNISPSCITAKYVQNPYTHTNVEFSKEENVECVYITTNYRVIVENGWFDDLHYLCEPTNHHERRYTVLFGTQVAISREFNRHSTHAIAESSTRYCNYSKDKFGNQITVNLPSWLNEENHTLQELASSNLSDLMRKAADCIEDGGNSLSSLEWWLLSNLISEVSYMKLIQGGSWSAQQARTILPLDTHTDLVHTAFAKDWRHFFDLRVAGTTGAPHPDAVCVARPLYEYMKTNNLI